MMKKVIYCDNCKRMVSDKAKVCPYCHMKLKPANGMSGLMYVIILAPLILAMSGVCGFYLFNKNNNNQEWLNNQSVYNQDEAVNPTLKPTDEAEAVPAEKPEQDKAAEPTQLMTDEELAALMRDAAETEWTPNPPIVTVPSDTPPPTIQPKSTPDKHGNMGNVPPKFKEYKASSAAEDVYSAGNAFDGDMDTAWGTGGENGGIGESITLISDEYQAVSGVKIYNGNTKDEETFKSNARISIVELSFSDGSYRRFILQDGFSRNEPQIIYLDERINTKTIKIKILDKFGDSDIVCISEIAVF